MMKYFEMLAQVIYVPALAHTYRCFGCHQLVEEGGEHLCPQCGCPVYLSDRCIGFFRGQRVYLHAGEVIDEQGNAVSLDPDLTQDEVMRTIKRVSRDIESLDKREDSHAGNYGAPQLP